MSPFLIILIIFFNSVLAQSTLVTKLVHYLAFDSPFYDTIANKTELEISLIDLKHSIARASHLSTLNESTTLFNDDNYVAIDTRLSPTPITPPSGFLAHIQVGSELLDQFLIMDTGSSLTWINCKPCGETTGFMVPTPLFDPLDSSTFTKENCSHLGTFCDYSIKCGNKGTCSYRLHYAGDVYSKGYLARDSIKFQGSEEILQQLGFGCSSATNLPNYNGVLGLNSYKMSIVSQMQASKFAYCIGNISDRGYAYNTLSIGDGVDISGKITKLIVEDKYYLTLKAIKFDGIPLDINASIFKRNSYEYKGGMVVDTGTTYTFLPLVAVEKIEEKIIDLIEYYSLPLNETFEKYEYPMLCYDGVLTRDLRGWFPIVALQFEGEDADMELTCENMFRQMNVQSFCSVVFPTEWKNKTIYPFSILGNMMQQYFYMRYDLSQEMVAFERINCEFLYAPYF